jgi:hypothetical protein
MAQVSFPSWFVSCVIETNDSTLVGAGTADASGMTLEDAMFLYWKAKNFSLSGSTQFVLFGQNGTITAAPWDS